MRKRLIATFRRFELYLVAGVIGVVFVIAMGIVAWMLRTYTVTPPYEALTDRDLKRVHATAYLRHREDDGTPYLKVELHNSTLWWIKKIEFEFDGIHYTLGDSDAFRPLNFGALRCILEKDPPSPMRIEYDISIARAWGYPPAEVVMQRNAKKLAGSGLSGESSK